MIISETEAEKGRDTYLSSIAGTLMKQKDFFMSPYGVRMPWIIYGTAWKKDSSSARVEQAIGLGFRGIDTTCQPKYYNEAGVGDGVPVCLHQGIDPAELYLQTKFTLLSGQDSARVP